MWNRLLIAVSAVLINSPSGMAEEIPASEKVVAVDGYFRLKSEVGIYGIVTKRSGTKVVFQPCSGESKEIDDSEIEKTDNTCSDGGGPSFASTCNDTVEVQSNASGFFKGLNEAVEVGAYYQAQNGTFTSGTLASVFAGQPVVKVVSCNDYWSVGLDMKGVPVVQMLSLEPSKLKESQNLQWW